MEGALPSFPQRAFPPKGLGRQGEAGGPPKCGRTCLGGTELNSRSLSLADHRPCRNGSCSPMATREPSTQPHSLLHVGVFLSRDCDCVAGHGTGIRCGCRCAQFKLLQLIRKIRSSQAACLLDVSGCCTSLQILQCLSMSSGLGRAIDQEPRSFLPGRCMKSSLCVGSV